MFACSDYHSVNCDSVLFRVLSRQVYKYIPSFTKTFEFCGKIRKIRLHIAKKEPSTMDKTGKRFSIERENQWHWKKITNYYFRCLRAHHTRELPKSARPELQWFFLFLSYTVQLAKNAQNGAEMPLGYISLPYGRKTWNWAVSLISDWLSRQENAEPSPWILCGLLLEWSHA